MSKAIIRRRFPRFICDGYPLGPNEEDYRHTLASIDDFYVLEWVQEKEEMGFIHWYIAEHDDAEWYKEQDLAVPVMICSCRDDGEAQWFGLVIEGDLDLPFVTGSRGLQDVYDKLGLNLIDPQVNEDDV